MEKSNSLMKAFCFLSIIAVASSLTGCTAILWSANNPIEHGNDYRTEIKDSVSGAVEYKIFNFQRYNPVKRRQLTFHPKALLL